ncbi:MAG: aminotransferase class V-fold PLP-dependent enzyme [Leptospiraceae bacterium]|nr:aminotransferase class V-fold PLP-dependent enzyme [Leptospiraceae bacterium]MDW8306355.1 aminotransferase class V-fold PLP-dependent enzyme [Leptospiraceae bacterium]
MDFLHELRRSFPELFDHLEEILRHFPFVEKWFLQGPLRPLLEEESKNLLSHLKEKLKPYQNTLPVFASLPPKGLAREEIWKLLSQMQQTEMGWQKGLASGAVYHGSPEHIALLNEAYSLFSQVNPLHFDLWPSASKMESEIISMAAHLFTENLSPEEKEEICGSITSGGTESIILAMKAYRDQAREERGIKQGEIIIPQTAHVAFEKAAHYLGLVVRKVGVDDNYRARVDEVKKAIQHSTICLVGSAPAFPHGSIDPIEELSELAFRHGIGFHTDACLGGFILPFAKKLGYEIPAFDFSLRGVTSLSADTHKYGYAAKGTSIILYRTKKLRQYQYFTATDWPGGLYFSPTMAGSRPGGLLAACYAAMLSLGYEGYLANTQKILHTAQKIRDGIAQIPHLKLIGNPLFIITFTSNSPHLDIYQVLDNMSQRGYSLNGLQRPRAIHLAVTLRHCEADFVERFLHDLTEAVRQCYGKPASEGTLAPVYGLAESLPIRGAIHQLLKTLLDAYYST